MTVDVAAAYYDRLGKLKTDLDRATSPAVREVLQRAVDLTDDVGHTLVDLSDALSESSQQHAPEAEVSMHWIATSAEEITRRADEVLTQVKGRVDEETLAEIDDILVRTSGKLASINAVETLETLRGLQLRGVEKLNEMLDEILRSDVPGLGKEVALQAISVLASFLPGALVADVVAKGFALKRFRQRQADSADDYHLAMDAYCEALAAWDVAARETIRRL